MPVLNLTAKEKVVQAHQRRIHLFLHQLKLAFSKLNFMEMLQKEAILKTNKLRIHLCISAELNLDVLLIWMVYSYLSVTEKATNRL
jgi:hypothetical protein